MAPVLQENENENEKGRYSGRYRVLRKWVSSWTNEAALSFSLCSLFLSLCPLLSLSRSLVKKKGR